MHLSRQYNCRSLRCSWSIACRRCSNYIFILDSTSGFKVFSKDSRKTVREYFMCWDLVRLILKTWQYVSNVILGEPTTISSKKWRIKIFCNELYEVIPGICSFSKFHHENQGQGHGWSQSSKSHRVSTMLQIHIPFVSNQTDHLFLKYSCFKICINYPNIQCQGHIMGPTSYQLSSLSLHVNWPSYSWNMAIWNFDLENPGSR